LAFDALMAMENRMELSLAERNLREHEITSGAYKRVVNALCTLDLFVEAA
jgi:hypothetical protein